MFLKMIRCQRNSQEFVKAYNLEFVHCHNEIKMEL
jgi:hypothetical protein